jgi:hypothetical protein
MADTSQVTDQVQMGKHFFLLVYDEEKMAFQSFCQGTIPLPLLVNALEMAKADCIGQQRAAMFRQAQQAQSPLVLPDGSHPPRC